MREKMTCWSGATLVRLTLTVGLGAIVAGCSGGSARFADDFYTGAVPVRPAATINQANSGTAPNYNPQASAVYQPAPVNAAPAATAVSRAPVSPPPVNATSQAPNFQPVAPQANGVVTADQPRRTFLPINPGQNQAAQPVQTTDPIQTASVKPEIVSTASKGAGAGWSNSGANYVTAKAGETVETMAKRYGVPAKAIREANNLSSSSLSTGQRIMIPSYVYSLDKAPAKRPVQHVPQAAPVQTASAASTAAPAASSPANTSGGRYTVVGGDTLSAISRKTGASVSAIRRTNNLASDTLNIGQSLIIPGLTGDVNQATASAKPVDPINTAAVPKPQKKPEAGYTPPTVANKKKPEQTTDIAAIDKKSTEAAPAATGVKSMRWPAKGRIITGFQANDGGAPNEGIDISVPQGTAVKAAENGVVIYAGDGLKELGKTVLIRHDDGVVTVYGHADALKVKRGDKVTRGQDIALSGKTGSARVPKLHFEVRKNTKPVDPVTYLQ